MISDISRNVTLRHGDVVSRQFCHLSCYCSNVVEVGGNVYCRGLVEMFTVCYATVSEVRRIY